MDLYLREIEAHGKNEEQKVDVWVLALPEIVFERCKPQSKRTGLGLTKGSFGKRQTARSDLPLLADVLDQSEEAIFDDVPDFHRQVKAQLLKVGIPSQLVRETTLSPDSFKNSAGYNTRHLQDAASVAWNLATGLYYKTQPKPPWRLAHVRPRRLLHRPRFQTHSQSPAAARVLCGANVSQRRRRRRLSRRQQPYKTSDHEFHLKTLEAKNLIAMVLKTYKEKHGAPPKELFIHGRARFNDEEWAAFKEAAPEGTTIIGVRVRTTGGEVKLFRDGDYPVLRGTAMILGKASAYLWTSGFLPRLDTYIGPGDAQPAAHQHPAEHGRHAADQDRARRHHGADEDQL